MSRGKRESQWQVMRRCLAIIRRALRGPANWEALVEAVLEQEGEEAYGEAEGSALHRRFENDLQRIRRSLMVDLRFDRQVESYVIQYAWTPLLDLPDVDLETIAWLEETFDPESPRHNEVQELLERLQFFLGVERLKDIERCRSALRMDLSQRDEDKILPEVQEKLKKALLERRQVEFLYISPQHVDRELRRHVVDPYEQYFDISRGHYYLYAYCRRCIGPDGETEPNRYITYRVGRIFEPKVLPKKLSPVPPAKAYYRVAYKLMPEAARTGVSGLRWIEVEEIDRCEDGSAVVHGKTSDLFWAIQSLLHYGHTCRVLGGPEMVREMTNAVRRMAEIYARSE